MKQHGAITVFLHDEGNNANKKHANETDSCNELNPSQFHQCRSILFVLFFAAVSGDIRGTKERMRLPSCAAVLWEACREKPDLLLYLHSLCLLSVYHSAELQRYISASADSLNADLRQSCAYKADVGEPRCGSSQPLQTKTICFRTENRFGSWECLCPQHLGLSTVSSRVMCFSDGSDLIRPHFTICQVKTIYLPWLEL